jgi:phosphatidylglycerol:prolipoprotein diacylglycerol transferase
MIPPTSPVALSLGPLQIRWYGLLITLGMVLAVSIAAREAARKNLNPQIVWDGALWVIALGIIGARLYHVFSTPNDGSGSGWPYYSQHPLEIIAIWKGGLGIFGGLIGGLVGIAFVAWRNTVSLLKLSDCIALGVPLAQAIGRWGNFFNQELYGPPTGSAWGVIIAPQYRTRNGKYDFTDLQAYPPDTRFHPTFLYESMWNLIGFVVLLFITQRFGRNLKDGTISGLYLIWYGIGRIWVELLFRPDAWTLGVLPTAVWVSLGVIAAGIALLTLGDRQRVNNRCG